ncbi:putative GRIP domain-containing protein [Medicago truncatula]|uniref:GRIP domain protein n=1 Tax=Medicago truncatula TaxID=3880 RepID=G7K011_MEDTR|nr:protein GRIP [Medicago truncatula]AES95278.1 GRIP domain protein [Medicago truncatula]RHN54429.1 putative GRIP domain-containing protein [Medicago truncatula]
MGRSKKNKKSMASGEGDTGGKMEIRAEDSSRPENHLSDSDMNQQRKDESDVNIVFENGLSDGNEGPADTGGTVEIRAQDSSKPEEHLLDGNEGPTDTGGTMEIHAQDSCKPEEHLSDRNEGLADTGRMMEIHAQDSSKPEEHLSDSDMNQQSKDGSNTNLVLDNRFSDGNEGSADTHDELLQMVVDLKSQNEFLKSQIEGFSNVESVSRESSMQKEVGGTEDGESDIVKELRERIELLNKEFLIEKQTRIASEEALKHLQIAYSDAEAKAKDLSEQLVEAQNKLEHEIKERDEKYSELDAKLNRLHKRAKQRIQEVQKEKDDLEARFSELNESAERASSQQSALQQELERTRKQANEALKAMDGDRQQLRSANNKLRDTIEDLRRSLQPKEEALESLQLSLAEKEQMLEDMRGLLRTAEEKRQAALAELSAKHQKNMESLEAQLNDAVSDRRKAAESISSLQVLVAEKESKIAEMEAASTGEAARLRAAMESVKGEISHVKQEHEKERESWEAASQALKAKLQIAESNCIRAEVEVAKIRSQLESEVSAQAKILSMRDSELLAAKEEISSLEREFSSYKARAHALLQKKDADLIAAKDSEQLKALEEALKEAENEVLSITEERDRALQDLQSAMANNEKELAERDTTLENVKQQIRSLEIKLDSVSAQHLKEKEEWGLSLQNVEETWRIRCEAMKAENEAAAAEDMQKELEELKQRCKKLKDEHASFHDLADRMIEDKDNEISRLLDENKNLRQSLQSRPPAGQNDNYNTVLHKLDPTNLSPSDAEHQILILARQQAQREEELAQSQRHILALQEEIEELEHENRLHSQQEAMLKSELRNMERAKKREGVDMTYLKNIILKLLETGEVEVLLPVIGMLLQFSPEEMQKCQQTYQNSTTDVPPSPASDSSGSGLSLFSRFSFT